MLARQGRLAISRTLQALQARLHRVLTDADTASTAHGSLSTSCSLQTFTECSSTQTLPAPRKGRSAPAAACRPPLRAHRHRHCQHRARASLNQLQLADLH